MVENLSKTYNPQEFEGRLYDYWREKDLFVAERDEDKEPFTIIMPPPNVTGRLHMGHALQGAYQDVIIRWKRMEGYSALLLPGTDHASISTEARVVNKLKAEGKSKEDLGREGFLEEAWEWTRKYGGAIEEQMKEIGVSCDWSRKCFTLDEGPSKAVEEVFIKLYEKDLIYRGDRIINWCPDCMTAISDAEVEHVDHNESIWHIRYPVKDSDEFIEIATTRPETLLGDLAVAVNPEDERYEHLIGKTVILPLVAREIPIVADDYVDMEFGSGAVKITPSHDPNDFDIGERHDLGQCIIMNEDATISENGGEYEGLDRFEAREKIVADLKEGDFLVEIKDYDNSVGHCERCNTVIEPLLSKQWFVKMAPLAKPALDAYKNEELNFIPKRFGRVYENWLLNIRDWCISRQLWWGHRLPVYYCEDCEEVMVAREKPGKCTKCDSTNIRRDEDTLDTWFSSALWPFSTLGWPDETEDLDYFFPTDVMITGYDIIFFWVVRMVFSSIEQTGEVPFKDVILTGLIQDELGRKMSKSLDNGIDPIEVIDEYGADALRFAIMTGSAPGNDMRFSYERVESSRNFANKLWNATRFVLMNLEEGVIKEGFEDSDLEEEDKWILNRLNSTIHEMDRNLNNYELGYAADRIHDFIWDEYCDWYIEMVKSRLYGDDEKTKNTAQRVLIYVLEEVLKLLHPYMPFITEEIWQHLPTTDGPLMIEEWPVEDEDMDYSDAEKNIEYIKDAIGRIRNARAEMNIIPSNKSEQIFVIKEEKLKNNIKNGERYFKDLASAESVTILDSEDGIPGDNISIVVDGAEIFLPLSELIDYNKEFDRLEKEKKRIEGEIKRVEGMLSNKGFVDNAPDKLVQEEKDKKIKYEEMMENVLERIKSVESKL